MDEITRESFVQWGREGGRAGRKTPRRTCPECGAFVGRDNVCKRCLRREIRGPARASQTSVKGMTKTQVSLLDDIPNYTSIRVDVFGRDGSLLTHIHHGIWVQRRERNAKSVWRIAVPEPSGLVERVLLSEYDLVDLEWTRRTITVWRGGRRKPQDKTQKQERET